MKTESIRVHVFFRIINILKRLKYLPSVLNTIYYLSCVLYIDCFCPNISNNRQLSFLSLETIHQSHEFKRKFSNCWLRGIVWW